MNKYGVYERGGIHLFQIEYIAWDENFREFENEF